MGSFASEEALPADTMTREVDPVRSQLLFKQKIAAVTSSGECPLATGGDVTRSTVITGEQTDIWIAGGAYVAGDVDVSDGDFVGRDNVVHGDEVHGDKI
jgi:hypothetical protein